MWNPEIILYNNIDGEYRTSLTDVPARVEYNGTISWSPLSLYKANCNIRVRQFPYDTQACTFMFKSWVYDDDEVSVTPVDNKLNLRNMKKHIEWELTGTEVRVKILRP